MNLLEQLKTYTKVVADTGDFDSMRRFRPVDATTNPSLILKASRDNRYASLIDDAIAYARHKRANGRDGVKIAIDKLMVNFGLEILKIIPGRVSTEVDARLSFDIEASVKKAHELSSLYTEAGIDRKRILIKLASTWEGIRAAEILTRDGIHCNMTLLFSMAQAIASADAGVKLISPFVGRLLDWYNKNNPGKPIAAVDEPGVQLVRDIYNYYNKFGYKTEIMGASFRNTGEIKELAGCDLLTIAPPLLDELEKTEGILDRKLHPEQAKGSDFEKAVLDEKKFRWLMNEHAMASDKLAEGIRIFSDDIQSLENILIKKL